MSLDQLAELAAAEGYHALCMRASQLGTHTPLDQVTEARRQLRDRDLAVSMVTGDFPIPENSAGGPEALRNITPYLDLAEALDAGEIGGAALDVMPVEPPGADHPLLGRDNVILSPHTGFYSIEALEELQTKTARGVVDVLQGNTPVYPINPEVLK